jgi:CheY-like chemotaxis protein
MIVEDEVDLLCLLRDELSAAGFTVSSAENGEVALALIDVNQSFDVIVTDVRMPKMNGYQLYYTLRTRGLTVPVVFLTGHCDEQELERAKSLGEAHLFEKPCSFLRLAHFLCSLIKS